MNNKIFKIIAKLLSFIADKTKLTYNEINIIVYYLLIPFSWLCLLDIIFNFHHLKIAFVIFTIGFFVGCRDFKTYSDWLFAKSVSFLNYFNRYGSNYFASSVWICVSLPILVYGLLLFLILK
ncbi:hypothetical protein SAMN05444412_109154 [Rhodonellum ikkaensis]|uniref:Uncharacterized protein n=1 Tax=Rhodonellum ikkaensis TaxID=336829 RepID=A0A1H3RVN1_9BACT|nr:hypothetical protein SAMN05444412_109154 [Rhodonellum ikkaensis]